MNRLKDLLLLAVVVVVIMASPQWACNRVASGYTEIEPVMVHENGMAYVSMNECASCHADVVEQHLQTSHYNTSSLSDFSDQLDLFVAGVNVVQLADQSVGRFEFDGEQAVQKWYERGASTPIFTAPMEITIGSGHRGQSFLFWKDDALYQHQGSLINARNQWINSPGYPSRLLGQRPIFPRCLECHASYAKQERSTLAKPSNTYIDRSVLFGMQCQVCHGEAIEHVRYHKQNPEDLEPQFILKYSDLTQKQRIDACALCHSGTRAAKWDAEARNFVPAFSYQIGDDLDDFFEPDKIDNNALENVDIHANQVKLLMSSKCFQESEGMDCATCHDPHAFERGNYQKFSAKCISCHSAPKHSEATLNSANANFGDCASCHMPFYESKAMQLELDVNALTPVRIRNHLIGIYKDKSLTP